MSIYDTLRPGWNAGYTILIGLTASSLIVTPAAMAQNRPEKPRESPYASRTYSPYSNASVRREREARRIAKAIREDERREERTSRQRTYREPSYDDDEDYD